MEKHDLMKYVVSDVISFNQSILDNTYIFTHNKYRIVGKGTWYTTTPENMFKIFKNFIECKYGNEISLENKVFNFGKYRNKRVVDVVEEDPKYINWCKENLPHDTLYSLGLMLREDIKPAFETVWERIREF